jgi:predicted metal-binding protein
MGSVRSASQETCHPANNREPCGMPRQRRVLPPLRRVVGVSSIPWSCLAPAWRRWGMSVSEQCRPRLIICTTCRAGRTLAEDEPTPGAQLHAELERLIVPSCATASVELRQVACLANCERGCSGVITMPGKWTYLLGFLSSEHATDLLTYGAAYASSANGTVLPSRRPASLRYAVVGRVPPMEFVV